LLCGSVRGVVATFFVPTLAVLGLVLLAANPTPIGALDVLVAGGGAFALGLWGARLLHLRAPFSYELKPHDVDMKNLGPVVTIMIASVAAGVAHGLLRLVPGAQALALLAIVPAVVVGWRRLALLEPIEPVPA
jgi:hypothetical protein